MPRPLPTISIVTPSYNQGEYVERTVRSVLLQRYPNLEYVLMDGGSTDNTMDVLAPYLDRFTHHQSAPDGGQSEAVRNGFEHTSGEIMAWLNSDDVLAPGALDFVADYFAKNPGVDAIYSNRVIVDADDTAIAYWVLGEHDDWLMSRWDLIPQETCFWRRSLYEKAGPVDDSYRFALDYELFTRFMECGRMERVQRFLGAFRMHDESKTIQQLETVGMREIVKVHQARGLTFGRWAKVRGPVFRTMAQLRAAWHVRRKHVMPGCLPGLGWDYDALWGGLMRQGALPPRASSQIETKPGAGVGAGAEVGA